MVQQVSNTNQQYRKPGFGAIIGGVLAGNVVNNIVRMPQASISQAIADSMVNISRSLSADEYRQVEEAVVKTVKNSGLADKGVEIIKSTSENTDEVVEIMSKEFNKGILKYFPKLKDAYSNSFLSQISSGKNACYASATKKIIMPEKELSLAMFHEAGHALNANLSTVGKLLQKTRFLPMLAVPISIIALFKAKKAPNEEPKNKFDKATTFIKNNAGKLTFASFLPVLLEEGLASIKGNKYAKELLSPELARKVAKSNALGFSTYLLVATLSGLGIFLGTKVKDAIAKPEPIEKQQ